MKVPRPAALPRRSMRLVFAPLLIVDLTTPVTVHALGSLGRDPQPTLASNLNDIQDLGRVSVGRASIRPAISSGNDSISGQVVDASTGALVGGATVYLSEVPQPRNHSSSAGPCAAAMQAATTDANGAYQFSGIGNDSYTRRPARVEKVDR